MITYPAEITAALAARRLRARDFLWITARNRDTGNSVSVGFWSGLTNVSSVPVIDPNTGDPVNRNFYGVGALVSIDDIPAIVGINTNDIAIRMSQLDEQVRQAILLYDIKQAEVQIFRGLFDPDTALLVAPAEPRFFGYVDHVEIVTPEEGDDGYAELTCTNQTLELFRANPATRSHADQMARHDGDKFFIDADTVGDWGPLQWGPMTDKVKSETQKKGLLGMGNFLGFL